MIETKRLILREWRVEDLEPFAQLNADPLVREYFLGILTRQESDALVKLMSDHIHNNGWGFWSASLAETNEFIGMIGLANVDFMAHFTPAVEIGWRLAHSHWGKGYATEGALACLHYGFKTLKLPEIVAFTASQNQRSMAVMERIGMQRNVDDDFDHPKLPEGHPLRKHALYRISKTPIA